MLAFKLPGVSYDQLNKSGKQVDSVLVKRWSTFPAPNQLSVDTVCLTISYQFKIAMIIIYNQYNNIISINIDNNFLIISCLRYVNKMKLLNACYINMFEVCDFKCKAWLLNFAYHKKFHFWRISCGNHPWLNDLNDSILELYLLCMTVLYINMQ